MSFEGFPPELTEFHRNNNGEQWLVDLRAG
jgi:hypothetical protein